MKEFLSREGAPFIERNVEEDERAYDELIGRGIRTVPLTIVGDRSIRGFNPPELETALAAWRGQKQAR